MRNWLAALLALLLACLVAPTLTGAQTTQSAPAGFLADRHKAAGVKCIQCHGVAAPKKGAFVEMNNCLKCHGGSYAALAQTTSNLGKMNPHGAHIGQLDCMACHHGHSTPTLYCAQCHSDFKVNTP